LAWPSQKSLEHFGCTVSFPNRKPAVASLSITTAFHPESAGWREIHRGFRAVRYIVTPSGSCCAMVASIIRIFFMKMPLIKRGCSRSFRALMNLSSSRQDLKVDLSSLSLAVPQTVTYHYTCHLRGLGCATRRCACWPRLAMSIIARWKKTDQCCGFGGTFAVKYPAISGAIVEDKVNCIAATKATTTIAMTPAAR